MTFLSTAGPLFGRKFLQGFRQQHHVHGQPVEIQGLDQSLSQQIEATWRILLEHAQHSDFAAILHQCFGFRKGDQPDDQSEFSTDCSDLTQRLLSGDRLGLRFVLVTAERLQGAEAAYVSESPGADQLILINREWLAQAAPAQIQAVLLEEIGHAIDQQLNGAQDSAGDEGELFAAILTDKPLSSSELAAIQAEDDHGTVLIHGAPQVVEFAGKSGSQAPPKAPIVNLTVQFANAYLGSIPAKGNANQPSQITLVDLAGAKGVYFVQADTNNNGLYDADTGNNIAGTLYVNGVSYIGTISRLYKDPGNVVGAFYFLSSSKEAAGKQKKAFLLDLPGGKEFLLKSTYQLSSDNVLRCLNDLLNKPPVDGNENWSTLEDIPLTGNVLANASDPNGDPLSVKTFTINGSTYNAGASVVVAGKGTIQINPNGAFTLTPFANYNGTFPAISYTVVDGKGGCDDSTLAISVTQVNDPGTFTGETSGSGQEDGPAITGTLTFSDSADGASDPKFTVTTAATNGNASINPRTGASSYTPNPDWNGSDSFSVSVTDDAGNTETQIINVTVAPVIDIQNDTASTPEDTALVLSAALLLANDSFENPAAAITSVSNAINGTVLLDGSNITFTPTPGYNGPASFQYTVSSGGVTETATVNISVTQGAPGILFGDAISVYEKNLEFGTEENQSALTKTSTFILDAPGGVSSLSIGDVVVINQQGELVNVGPFAKPGGVLTINGYDKISKTVTYSFTLNEKLVHLQEGIDTLTAQYDLHLEDGSGTKISDTLTITIYDDIPTDTGSEIQILSGNATQNLSAALYNWNPGADRSAGAFLSDVTLNVAGSLVTLTATDSSNHFYQSALTNGIIYALQLEESSDTNALALRLLQKPSTSTDFQNVAVLNLSQEDK